jgi:hypothetical protein
MTSNQAQIYAQLKGRHCPGEDGEALLIVALLDQ